MFLLQSVPVKEGLNKIHPLVSLSKETRTLCNVSLPGTHVNHIYMIPLGTGEYENQKTK